MEISFPLQRILMALILLTSTPHIFSKHPFEVRLLIKIPTRSRPEKFFKTLDTYYTLLSGKIPYQFLITCDTDDTTMNNPHVIKQLQSYPCLSFSFCLNKSKVAAYNCDLNQDTPFDILLVTSDDMIPCCPCFDTIIVETMLEAFSDFDGVLNFHDGVVGAVLNTLPIVGKKFFDRFGYVYHPDYTSLYCDEELTLVSRMLNKEKISDLVIIKHMHPVHSLGAWDALYLRNEGFYSQDYALFNQRKARLFDLDKHLIVNQIIAH